MLLCCYLGRRRAMMLPKRVVVGIIIMMSCFSIIITITCIIMAKLVHSYRRMLRITILIGLVALQ